MLIKIVCLDCALLYDKDRKTYGWNPDRYEVFKWFKEGGEVLDYIINHQCPKCGGSLHGQDPTLEERNKILEEEAGELLYEASREREV